MLVLEDGQRGFDFLTHAQDEHTALGVGVAFARCDCGDDRSLPAGGRRS
jgi:hypothetical protein